MAKKKKKKKFSFPSASRCPRCKSIKTLALSTQGNVQYRKCQVPICRHTYKVLGTEV